MHKLAVFGVGLLVLVWLSPWVASQLLLPYESPQLRVEASGTSPGWPLGVRAKQLDIQYQGAPLQLKDAHFYWVPAGLRMNGQVDDGNLLAMTDSTLSSGFLQLKQVPLEKLPIASLSGIGAKGSADGVIRYNGSVDTELWVNQGSISSRMMMGLGIGFKLLVLKGVQAIDGSWDIESMQMQGPPVTMNGAGKIASNGALDLDLTFEEVDPTIGQFLSMAGIPVNNLPAQVHVGGTTSSPRIQ